jgi:hypothetical protein
MAELKRGNSGALEQHLKNLKDLNGLEVKIGWFESSKYPDGRPVAAVAAGNEFGIAARSIPPRPFMRPTAVDKQGEIEAAAALLSTRVVKGQMTPFQAMDTLGGIIEGLVAQKIAEIQTPPLSQITLGARLYRKQGKKVTGKTIGEIAKKLAAGKLDVSGVSTKPLVDSALMVDTLTHVTEKTK